MTRNAGRHALDCRVHSYQCNVDSETSTMISLDGNESEEARRVAYYLNAAKLATDFPKMRLTANGMLETQSRMSEPEPKKPRWSQKLNSII